MPKLFKFTILLVLILIIKTSKCQNEDSVFNLEAYPFKLLFSIENNSLKEVTITNNSNKSIFVDTTLFYSKTLDSTIDCSISLGDTYIITLDVVDIFLQKIENGEKFKIDLQYLGRTNELVIHYINSKNDIKRIIKKLNKKKGLFSFKKGRILISREIFNHAASYIRICCFEKNNFRIEDIEITGAVSDTRKKTR